MKGEGARSSRARIERTGSEFHRPHVPHESHARKAQVIGVAAAVRYLAHSLYPPVMRITSLGLLALALAACASTSGSAPDPSTARTIALALLDRGARSWNRGDLDAFMADYVDGPRTSFVTNQGVMHGRREIRTRYAPRFAAGGVRDSLSFEGVEADAIAPDAVHVIAWYKLMRGDSLIARGPTSLVLVRVGERWGILKDHSS
jgi:hypothetical protein